MYTGLHVKCLLLLSDFDETFNFLDRLSENHQISAFMKIHPVGRELLHAERRDEPHSRISQFCERA
jgi:hypothetical protein